jgi:PAS domain S-box-containing protein
VFITVSLAFICLGAAQKAPARPPLTTVADARSMTAEEAGKRHPIEVTGVVTLSNPGERELFIQDETAGIYVYAETTPPGLKQGSRVRVTGVTDVGWFSPIIEAGTITPLGDAPLPDPLPYTFSLNDTRWLDARYVQTVCLVRGVESVKRGTALSVFSTAGPGLVLITEQIPEPALRHWVGSVVRVRGVCGPEYSQNGRLTGAHRLMVQSRADVTVVEPAERVAAAPFRSVRHVRTFLPGTSPIQLIRMAGVVTGQSQPGELLVQDGTGGFTVRHGAGPAPPVGTRVELTGFLTWTDDRLIVDSVQLTGAGSAPLPEPREVHTTLDLAPADGCRVQIRGRVTEVGTDHFTLVSEGMTLTVRLPDGSSPPVGVGGIVTVTGALAHRPAGVLVLPWVPADVVVIAGPERSWPTRPQAVAALAVAVFIALVFTVWLLSLRRAVRARTRALCESEQKFATAFHASPDAIVLTRVADGTILEVNEGYCRITGFTAEQVRGRSTLDLNWLDPTDRARMYDSIRAGGIRDYPARVRDAAGCVREVLISGTTVVVGGEDCLLGIVRDVTELNRAERAARNERLFVETMIESMPGALYLYDARGRFLRWNRYFETVTGYGAAELAHMHPLDFFVGADKTLLEERIREVFERGESSAEAEFIAKDGTVLPYYFTGRRVTFDGEPCLVGIGIDLSARRAAEKRLAESELRYRELVEHANSIILRWTPEGLVTFLNEFGQRFFGYSAAEIVGRHVMHTIVPATESSGRDLDVLMKEVCANPKLFERNVNENVLRSGERVWIAWTNRIVFDAAGKVVEILSIGSDITDQRRVEQALVASEKKFAAVFRLSPVALSLSRLDGTILDVNRAFEQVYKLRPEQVIGHRADGFQELYDCPEERAGYAERLRRDGYLRDIEVRRVLADGSTVDLVASAELIALDDIPHVLTAVTDVTPLKRAESALREANAVLERRVAARTTELVAANAELEAFCYSVSHDLRAPLRSIDGFSEAVLEDYAEKLDAEGADFLRRIRAAARRMGELIDDLLTLSRVARADLRRERVNVSALAADVVRGLRDADPGRTVEVTIEPGLSADGDRSLLRVVLENLIGNAWKYTSKTPTARIEVGQAESPSGPAFCVRDNGAGFDPAYAQKLFQPFQRLHRADEFPGHGIGLATVLRIVRRHGGEVSADGAVGTGACFRFTIPDDQTENRV